jgi:hypothetical protein
MLRSCQTFSQGLKRIIELRFSVAHAKMHELMDERTPSQN